MLSRHYLHYPRHDVASGSFIVAEAKPLVFQACLGTCVGLAVCDVQTRVGGMIHLLLPEPSSAGGPFRIAAGFPVFYRLLGEGQQDWIGAEQCAMGTDHTGVGP